MTTDTAVQAPTPATPARRTRRRLPVASVWVGLLLLVLATAIVSQTMSDFNIFVFNTCLLASMGAIALNVQLGTTGQVSLGNAAFLAVGAFTTAALSDAGIGFPWSILVAAVISGAVGLVIAVPALRLRGLYFALATVSAYFIIYFFCNRYQTSTVGEAGFQFPPVFTASYHDLQAMWAWLLTAVLAVVIIGASVITKGKVGRSLRIIRDHELAAPAFGVNVTRNKLIVFGLGFAVIGLQGGLTAYYSGLVTIDSFTLLLTIQYLAMVIIGGLDSIPGAVIGAFIVTILPTLITNLLSSSLGAAATVKGPQIATIVYGVLVIIFVTSSAGGIVGWTRSIQRLILRKMGR
jgi:branched-chain amino acid transport system permease protein